MKWKADERLSVRFVRRIFGVYPDFTLTLKVAIRGRNGEQEDLAGKLNYKEGERNEIT